MDETSEKVTKDPKHVDAGRKGRENYMKKHKESILNYAKKGSGDTTNASNETTSATNNASNKTTSITKTATARSNYTYVYGIRVLATGACIFFAYNLKLSMKNRINHQNDVICFRTPIQ